MTTDTLYERNAANNGWNTIVFEGNTQTLINKTINSADNSITSAGQTAGDILVNDGSKYARKARGAAHEVPQMNSAGTDIEFAKLDPENLNAITQYAKATPNSTGHSPDSGFADVTGASVTINAKGGKSGLVTIFVCTLELHQSSSNDSFLDVQITDENNNVKATPRYETHSSGTSGSLDGMPIPFVIMAVESTPNAGTVTRKIRASVDDEPDVTASFSNMQMFVMEVA